MKKIYFIATVEFAVNAFLINHLVSLSKYFSITVIVKTNDPNFLKKYDETIKVIPFNFDRKISFFNDFIALIKLIYIFLKEKPNVVHSITPKAGLISILASSITMIPIRIHTFTGQVWKNKKGFNRLFLKFIDSLIGRLTTFNIIDSPSQKEFLLSQGVIKKNNSIVFGSGSVAGVDFNKFKKSKIVKTRVRSELSIPQDAFVFIFLGRLNYDKGILDLAYAFSKINIKNVFLIIVGPDENNLTNTIKKYCKNNIQNLRIIPHSTMPQDFLNASDVICLPSLREGFGSVLIEAASIGVPSIASNIDGICDAVQHNKTGILYNHNVDDALLNSMLHLLENPKLVKKLGLNAKNRVIREFDSNILTKHWLKFYLDFIL